MKSTRNSSWNYRVHRFNLFSFIVNIYASIHIKLVSKPNKRNHISSSLLEGTVISLQEESVWAMLAGMATAGGHLQTAEVAYAAINQTDKVHYINRIKVRKFSLRKRMLVTLLLTFKIIRQNNFYFITMFYLYESFKKTFSASYIGIGSVRQKLWFSVPSCVT